jgi:antitoxin (DNA-binding transcriptional repressor) of toxin-antitoxin stability system
MTSVNIHEAKTHLSRLLVQVQNGEEVIISKAGKPVAKLSRIQPKQRAAPGFAKGTIKIVGDINDPMPKDWLNQFYNGPLSTNDRPRKRRKRAGKR